jgi:hypothetical protein
MPKLISSDEIMENYNINPEDCLQDNDGNLVYYTGLYREDQDIFADSFEEEFGIFPEDCEEDNDGQLFMNLDIMVDDDGNYWDLSEGVGDLN